MGVFLDCRVSQCVLHQLALISVTRCHNRFDRALVLLTFSTCSKNSTSINGASYSVENIPQVRYLRVCRKQPLKPCRETGKDEGEERSEEGWSRGKSPVSAWCLVLVGHTERCSDWRRRVGFTTFSCFSARIGRYLVVISW